MAPLLDLHPVTDTVAVIPVEALSPLHMDPEQPLPFMAYGMALDDLTETAVEEMLRLAGPGARTTIPLFELRNLGGELGRQRPENGGLPSLDVRYLVFAGGPVPTMESAVDLTVTLLQVYPALARWEADQMYLNFAENRHHPADFLSPQAYERLRPIKFYVDPDDLIQANHPVPPADLSEVIDKASA